MRSYCGVDVLESKGVFATTREGSRPFSTHQDTSLGTLPHSVKAGIQKGTDRTQHGFRRNRAFPFGDSPQLCAWAQAERSKAGPTAQAYQRRTSPSGQVSPRASSDG